MIRVAVIGASGRTGRHVIAAIARAPDLVLAAALCRPGSSVVGLDAGRLAGVADLGLPLRPLDVGCFADVDVVIDFSSVDALGAALDLIEARPLVTGTTGLDEETSERLAAQASRGPVLSASNFSTGIAILRDLVARAAAALPDYDLELIEAHHRHKVDAPSGTALTLAHDAARARGLNLDSAAVHGRVGQAGPRLAGEFGIHAVRGGGIVGDHQLWLVGESERLSLGHVAISRAAFADGAVRSARWLSDRPAGRYTLADVLGLTSA